MGTQTLTLCRNSPLTYCGTLDRALDPSGQIPDRIGIYFEWYPHLAPGRALDTLVATEGGPGYAATGSRDDYLALFAPLRATHDVLIMDNRGTGRSGALDCPRLQTIADWTSTEVGECGRLLGERAALYGTAYAADDLAAILEALGRGPIELYGDSYGTYFEQVFARRHPERLRAIVLDGAYPLEGPDYPWYPHYAPAMRAKFDLACARSPACAAHGGGIAQLEPVLEALRRAPYEAHALDSDGREQQFEADASMLALVMFSGVPALATVRELDAAGRAFLQGDRAPLERLMAETRSGVDSHDPNPQSFSDGLAAAVMCLDPPQIYDLRLAPAERAAARERLLAERALNHPDSYAPFTIEEFRRMRPDYSFIDQCIDWPAPPPSHPPAQVVPPGSAYPDVPALVISGDLDAITPVADGTAVAHAFPRGHQVILVNSFHVNALPRARSDCGARLAQRFLASGSTGDEDCARAIPLVRLVVRFARRAEDLPSATVLPGNRASPEVLAIAAAAAATVGDVLARVRSNSSGHGPGLRGGRVDVRRQGEIAEIRLAAVRFTDDVSVSGIVRARGPRFTAVSARLSIDSAPQRHAPGDVVELSWREDGAAPSARIGGRLGGRRLEASLPAP